MEITWKYIIPGNLRHSMSKYLYLFCELYRGKMWPRDRKFGSLYRGLRYNGVRYIGVSHLHLHIVPCNIPKGRNAVGRQGTDYLIIFLKIFVPFISRISGCSSH